MGERAIDLTTIIIILNVIFSVAGFSKPYILRRFIFNPVAVRQNNQWERFITSGFLHGGWLHLLINMFVLFQFGQFVEQRFRQEFDGSGYLEFMVLYIGALVISELPSYFKHRRNPNYNSLGASGAVAAILFTFILFEPWWLLYLFGLIPVPAVVFGALYLFYSARMARQGEGAINHDAHFWGAVFGFGFTGLLKPMLYIDFLRNLFSFV